MTVAEKLTSRLVEILGPHRVVSAPEELAAHAIDGLTPQAVVCPESAEQVAEVVRLAAGEKLAVQAFGSRSKCEMGMPAARCDVAIDMTGMREVAHYDAGDLTLSVDAGLPLRELEAYLSKHGQFLPLAVPCFESTTAGGALASGIDSALRQQYGSARDFLIGAEFVDGTGQLCKSGGRVVKNVTGYDLHKLLIGSLGTLGVITRLNFRTYPFPAASGACAVIFDRAENAVPFCGSVAKKGLPLAALEILDPGTVGILRAILQRGEASAAALLTDGTWCVYCSFEGTEAVVRRITEEVKRATAEQGGGRCEVLDAAAGEQLGGMLREAYEWLRWSSGAVCLQRIALPEITAVTVAELGRIAEAALLRHALLARGAGVVYFATMAEAEDDASLDLLARAALKAKEIARRKNGQATVLHAPLAVKTKLAAARVAQPDEPLQLRLKRAFDPANLFAPGRIVGGI